MTIHTALEKLTKPSFFKVEEGFSILGKDWHLASTLQLLYSKVIQGLLGMGKVAGTKFILSLLPMREENPYKS